MKVWIDIINPSHALFFNAILRELNSENILITVRDRAETCELVKSFGMPGVIIGKYYEDSLKKSFSMISRTIQLYSSVKDFDFALSFENGMSIVVSKARKKKSILFCDNDLKFIERGSFFQDLESKIKFYADVLLVPKACHDTFKKYLKKDNLVTFNGFKEDVYVADFTPDSEFMQKIPFDEYIVLRPEALGSFYVKGKKTIVPELLRLFNKENINIIYLPRENDDKRYANGFDVYIPKKIFNGLDLIYYANAVLTGSGTMVREAACMGKTAVSFFPDESLLSVDKQLVNEGKIYYSREPKEIVDYVISNFKHGAVCNCEKSKIVKKEIIQKINHFFNEHER